jgi:hypothetical protein
LVTNIFKGSRDGWSKEVFGLKVFYQGPTIVLVKTKLGAICGGFTSKSWPGSGGAYANDNAAFVFNLNEKFIPCNYDKAIYLRNEPLEFGNNILAIRGAQQLNADNVGYCYVGTSNYYNISGDSEGKSPLTGEKTNFTCVELEVYKVVNY